MTELIQNIIIGGGAIAIITIVGGLLYMMGHVKGFNVSNAIWRKHNAEVKAIYTRQYNESVAVWSKLTEDLVAMTEDLVAMAEKNNEVDN